jgi:hypothetical protein
MQKEKYFLLCIENKINSQFFFSLSVLIRKKKFKTFDFYNFNVYLEKKNSMCFDSGMPSTTSNNSDSACSQAFSSSDTDGQITNGFYDRSDGEHLVHGRLSNKKILLPDIQQLFFTKLNVTNDISSYTIGGENHLNVPINGRISSEEESGFSTPTKSHQGKKLVYEVVV